MLINKHILLATLALMLAACSSDTVVDEPFPAGDTTVTTPVDIPDTWSIKAFKYNYATNARPQEIERILFLNNYNHQYYLSRSTTSLDTTSFNLDVTRHYDLSQAYSAFVLPNNDVLFVYRTEFAGGNTSDGNRHNPIIYRAEEGYKAHIIDFGNRIKPSGWLQNVGACYSPRHNALFIAEYTRGNVPKARCWRVDMPVTDPDNWHIVLEKDIVQPYGSGFKHFHTAQIDPYVDVVYFTSGDDDTSSAIWASTDGGQTFSQLGEYNRRQWRMLNMVFTPDYIFWASDDWSDSAPNHALWRARRDFRGILDPNSLAEVFNFHDLDLETFIRTEKYLRLATYATVYLSRYNALLLLDRDDQGSHNALQLRVYDIDTGTMHIAATIEPTKSYTPWGFRCETVELYPEGDTVLLSFAPRYENYITPPSAATTYTGTPYIIQLKITKTADTYRATFNRASILP